MVEFVDTSSTISACPLAAGSVSQLFFYPIVAIGVFIFLFVSSRSLCRCRQICQQNLIIKIVSAFATSSLSAQFSSLSSQCVHRCSSRTPIQPSSFQSRLPRIIMIQVITMLFQHLVIAEQSPRYTSLMFWLLTMLFRLERVAERLAALFTLMLSLADVLFQSSLAAKSRTTDARMMLW
jgi:hypothetical protein